MFCAIFNFQTRSSSAASITITIPYIRFFQELLRCPPASMMHKYHPLFFTQIPNSIIYFFSTNLMHIFLVLKIPLNAHKR